MMRLALLLSLLVPGLVMGGSNENYSLMMLVNNSDKVVVGTVSKIRYGFKNSKERMPITRYTLTNVDLIEKGKTKVKKIQKVTINGGIDFPELSFSQAKKLANSSKAVQDNRIQTENIAVNAVSSGEIELELGQTYVLFLNKKQKGVDSITGGLQGALSVSDQNVVRDNAGFIANGISPTGELTFSSLIRSKPSESDVVLVESDGGSDYIVSHSGASMAPSMKERQGLKTQTLVNFIEVLQEEKR